jgi:predicted N-acyltransferase
LHFEVCFYRGIEDAIARKLLRFEPGAGGEHKLARGFEATPTYSVHHLKDPRFDLAVRDFLEREDAALQQQILDSRGESGLRPLTDEGSATAPRE